MQAPPIPSDESKRLASLKELNILDTPAEERYDRITRITQEALNVENSAINLVDEDRQWGKSTCGIEGIESPRDESFCGHAIIEDSVTAIPNAKKDGRFKNNPFVTGDPYIRFYIGYPVHAPDGKNIGTLCAFDSEPREPTERNRELIKDLASLVDSEIERGKMNSSQAQLREDLEEAERRARVDHLTELWNRRAIFDLIKSEVNRTRREDLSVSVAMCDVDDFKQVNDTHGHQAGDKVLKKVAQKLREAIRDYDILGRYGGEEFVAVFPEADKEQTKIITERMKKSVEETTIEHAEITINVTLSIGVRTASPDQSIDSKTLIDQADKALFHAKENGKNQVSHYQEVDDFPDVKRPENR